MNDKFFYNMHLNVISSTTKKLTFEKRMMKNLNKALKELINKNVITNKSNIIKYKEIEINVAKIDKNKSISILFHFFYLLSFMFLQFQIFNFDVISSCVQIN